MDTNLLYYGDNLDVLRRHVKDETVDLVYIDPPFNSNANYNVLFKEQDGSRSAAQIQAFGDTWRWDQAASQAYGEVVQGGGRAGDAMWAFRTLVGENDMLAYLAMMAPRLVELRRVLKPTGSIYLHCDPTASHYLKLLMDAVFGPKFFRNEVIWQRTSSHNDPSRYGRIHDVLLYYTKSGSFTWNQQYEQSDERYFSAHDFERDADGKQYRKRDLTAPAHSTSHSGQYEWRGKRPPPGRMWSYTEANMERLEAEGRIVYTQTGMPRLKIGVEDLRGVPYQDVWVRPDLWLNAASSERLGYPTQKPEAILERIVRSSSSEGDTILDAFCGCGTAIAASQRLGRRWIGIDITHVAINLIKHRLLDAFGQDVAETYRVIGEPTTIQDAARLAKDDPYQFQFWALGLVGARPHEERKGADRGVDGRLHFLDDATGKPKQIIMSVKAGHTGPMHVRDLRGVIDREGAQIGVLITMQIPTQPMRSEAASSGVYHSPGWGKTYPRLQIVTVEELLAGKQVNAPPIGQTSITFKQAPRAKAVGGPEQVGFGLAGESGR